MDPAPFVDANDAYEASELSAFQVPDPTWEWAHKDWYVDMTLDVDASGWQYGFSFQTSSFTGTFHPLTTFVRRRRWLRLRRKMVDMHVGVPWKETLAELPESSVLDPRLLYHVNMDRDRLNVIEAWIRTLRPGDDVELPKDKACMLLEAMDFMQTKLILVQVMQSAAASRRIHSNTLAYLVDAFLTHPYVFFHDMSVISTPPLSAGKQLDQQWNVQQT
jgi:hypothetical protein